MISFVKALKHSVLWVVFSVFVTLSASAGITNPLIRVCLSLNGQFYIANLDAADGNDLPMCQFNTAQIGAQALLDYVDGRTDLAISAFLASSPSDPMQVCSQNSASDLQGTSESSSLFHICEFPDSSLIDAETLARGANAIENSALRNALQSHLGGAF